MGPEERGPVFGQLLLRNSFCVDNCSQAQAVTASKKPLLLAFLGTSFDCCILQMNVGQTLKH